MGTHNPVFSPAHSSVNRFILPLTVLAILVASAVLADIAVQSVHDIGIFSFDGNR